MEQRNYMAEVQALIDLKWKENPEEMKRIMEERKKESIKINLMEKLNQELLIEMNKEYTEVDALKIKDLIERGANVNTRDKWGLTPLHWACDKNSIELTKMLIEKGANINAIDNDGYFPFYYLCDNNRENVEHAELILDMGFDPNSIDEFGSEMTPLHYACLSNSLKIAKLLLEKGADLSFEDSHCRIPFDCCKTEEMRNLLMEYYKK